MLPLYCNLSKKYNIDLDAKFYCNILIIVSFGSMKLSRHPCEIKLEDTAEIKSNFKYLVWEISGFKPLSFHVKLVWEISNFKHLKFKLLVMKEFKEEDKMMNFIKLII